MIVPAYNSQEYLDRCLRTLVGYGAAIEVIIVNDGSHDQTAQIANSWARLHPATVRVIHQENAGHGGALNTGIAAATGIYLKVVDSDDWVDRRAMRKVLEVLDACLRAGEPLDLLITNYVYEKRGRAHKAVIRYRNVLPENENVTWEALGRCRYDQYLMMHALILRTDLLRASGMVLPTHTFYVDYLYSFIPLPRVARLRYLDVDLYRYFIGRDDQSVNETVMIGRVDQLLRVNKEMVAAMPRREDVSPQLYRYMAHYLRINFVVCSMMLLLSGTPEHLRIREGMWKEFARKEPQASAAVRSDLLGILVSVPGQAGRALSFLGYKVSQALLGYN